MAFRRTMLALGLIATVGAGPLYAQEKGKPAADEQTGLNVGDQAPAFTLNDQNGKPRSLDDLLKKGKVALVFYRSADW